MTKWAIIALHNALQGVMICHLSGTAALGAMRKDTIRSTLEWLNDNRVGGGLAYPDQKVADTSELFKRLTGQTDAREQAGDIIAVSDDEQQAFSRLHAMRREFSHFSPKSWTIHVGDLAGLFSHIGAITERIIDAGYAFRHADGDLIAEARTSLASLRSSG